MAVTRKVQLDAVARIHKQLHKGNVNIKDADLKAAIPAYREVLQFFSIINDRKFLLTTASLREDFLVLQQYAMARKMYDLARLSTSEQGA